MSGYTIQVIKNGSGVPRARRSWTKLKAEIERNLAVAAAGDCVLVSFDDDTEGKAAHAALVAHVRNHPHMNVKVTTKKLGDKRIISICPLDEADKEQAL